MDITDFHKIGDLYWHGCYTSFKRWDSYVTNESYAHPAKMSPTLCERIFKHLKKYGLLKESDIVCDFMAGISTTNIIASIHRMKTISIELEPHFIKMEKENKKKLENFLGVPIDWEIIQGDSRNLSKIIKDQCVGIVSPPYTDIGHIAGDNADVTLNPERLKMQRRYTETMRSAGNIQKLPDRPMVGIVSPPYSESQSGGGIAKEGYKGKYIHDQGNPDRVADRCGYVAEKHVSPNNIANLPDKVVGIVSPPYADMVNKSGGKKILDYHGLGISTKTLREHSKDPQNIGNLSDIVGIVSPPFENSEGSIPTSKFKNIDEFVLEKSKRSRENKKSNYASPEAIKREMEKTPRGYEASKDNIGNQQGETYLDAMFRVYKEAYNVGISPLVIVTKNPTRAGKLRRLDIDTANLLMAVGYEIIDYHRAVLFKEEKYRTLDGKIIKHPKGRVGFFKRLAYQKGSEIARWEDIFIATIPSV